MYKYLFFDLDGTLTDSQEGITKSVSYALINLGLEDIPFEERKKFIGPPLLDSFMNICKMDEETAREAIRLYRSRYSEVGKYENRPYDGIPLLLEKLKKDNRVLIIASSKPTEFVVDILKKFDIYEYFDIISGADMAGLKGSKEDVISEALKELDLNDDEKKQVVMIGDRHYDILGAKYFGLDSIGVGYGFAKDEAELVDAGCTYYAKTVDDLARILFE